MYTYLILNIHVMYYYHCVLLGVSIKVLVVDLESDQVLPPTSVRGEQDWTVGELKTFLKSVCVCVMLLLLALFNT